MRQDDLDLSEKYFLEDFEKITDRRKSDYFTGISLQNTQFSETLDYVQNLSKKAGTFS